MSTPQRLVCQAAVPEWFLMIVAVAAVALTLLAVFAVLALLSGRKS